MKIYNSEEMNSCSKYTASRRSVEKTLYLHYPEGSNWYGYSCAVADLARFTYAHNEDYIIESLKQCTIPYKEKLLENLDIFLTSYPSASHVNGAADGKGIVLYGRGTQIPRAMTHYITMHELGHVLWFRYFYYKKDKVHEKYYELRDWPKEESIVVNTGERFIKWKDEYDLPWHEQISEFFAEDFRYLFGGKFAKQDYWGLSCKPPGNDIKEFILEVISNT